MLTRHNLNDFFLIRNIIGSAVPAAHLATTAALSTIAPANAQRGGAHRGALLTSGSFTMIAMDTMNNPQDIFIEGDTNDSAQYTEQ